MRRAAASLCVPSMNTDLEVKVLWEVGRNDPSEPQSDDREGVAERSGVARPAGRRTEIGYEAERFRASGHMTAKLSRPRSRSVNPALVQGQSVGLPGEILPYARKDDVGKGITPRSEKSAAAIRPASR